MPRNVALVVVLAAAYEGAQHGNRDLLAVVVERAVGVKEICLVGCEGYTLRNLITVKISYPFPVDTAELYELVCVRPWYL